MPLHLGEDIIQSGGLWGLERSHRVDGRPLIGGLYLVDGQCGLAVVGRNGGNIKGSRLCGRYLINAHWRLHDLHGSNQ